MNSSSPAWARGDRKQVRSYYAAHQMGWIDRLIFWIASRLGLIIDGNLSLQQIEAKLEKFPIHSFLNDPSRSYPFLSPAAQSLIYQSFEQLDRVIDIHMHLFGLDEDNYLNPLQARGKNHLKYLAMKGAAGIRGPLGSTEAAADHLYAYARHFPKLHAILLPIHQAWTQEGEADLENTICSLSNNCAQKAATSFQAGACQHLAFATSIHPYDPEWSAKLEEAHAQGIRLVKWMPPQGIQPDALDIAPFYEKMARLEMVLLAHAGPEHTFPSRPEWRDFGNPLRFRRPLQMGVTLILAHCAHQEPMVDWDDPNHNKIEGCELFVRLAKEVYHSQSPTKLYGDLAAIIAHYPPRFIKRLLELSEDPAIHYLYGSDYPLTHLVHPCKENYTLLAKEGLLAQKFVFPLKEIRAWNPLIANFVLARSLFLQNGEKKICFPLKTFTGSFEDARLEQVFSQKDF